MNILVVGSGAREHALCWRLSRDPGVHRVVCAPGNAGIARSVPVAPVDAADPAALLALAEELRADLTVIGPEGPLAAGVVDLFARRGRPIFGPRQAAARLETSKAFAKDFMARHGVPTARYLVCHDAEAARSAIRSGALGDRIVVKADGLAAGKGVVVTDSRAEAERAVVAAMVERAYGAAGATIVLEERIEGPEVSYFVIADGEHAVTLVTAQDHKRIFDGDRGPNTGGMGAFAPSPIVDAALSDRVQREIVRPVLDGLVREGMPYRGVLYCGLMLTADGPKVIEFNVRFGDPEAQVVLPLIDEPLAPLLWETATGVLRSRPIATHTDAAVGVVLAAAGYPGDVRTDDIIEGFDRVAADCPDVLVFCAGVKPRDGALATAGGRVLTVVGRGATFEAAIARSYDAAARLSFAGMQYRRDIGRKAQEYTESRREPDP
jgi:phosphoribosylamine---glycine ligase